MFIIKIVLFQDMYKDLFYFPLTPIASMLGVSWLYYIDKYGLNDYFTSRDADSFKCYYSAILFSAAKQNFQCSIHHYVADALPAEFGKESSSNWGFVVN